MGLMSIVVSADDNYAQHAGVTLASVAANTSSVSDLQCYVMDFGISSVNRRKMHECAEKFGFDLRILTPELGPLGVLPQKRYGPAAWARLLIPDLIPSERAIYLDCDVIVEADVRELWNTDMEKHPIAAVADGIPQTRITPTTQDYFNSGVMLMDLALWRDEGLMTTLTEYATKNHDILEYPDQDALNGVLHKRWRRLDLRWNVNSAIFSPENHEAIAAASGYDLSDVERAFFFPAIIHFSSPRRRKPWMVRTYHPLAHRYWKYLRATPWHDYVPPDRNLIGLFQRYRRYKDVLTQKRLRLAIEQANPSLVAG